MYSYLSNKRGGWNKRGQVSKIVKSINVEDGICESVGQGAKVNRFYNVGEFSQFKFFVGREGKI